MIRVLLFLALSAAALPVLAASNRVALIIGNSSYEHVPHLPNPANDARDLAASLSRLGFEVDLRVDLNYRDTRLALRDFSAQAESAEIALIYYAGHGVEIERKNYIIPVNAQIKSDRDIEFEAVPLDQLLTSVRASKGLKIVLLDACRNNPFLVAMERSTASRSVGRGLARIEPSNIVVGYAAREGTLALDGDGRNSPYARALLDHLEQPGLELGKMLRKVRDQVFTRTEGLQEPFVYGSLPAKDIFLKKGEQLASVSPSNELTAEVLRREERRKQMSADFDDAQKFNTLFRWDAFIKRYDDMADEPTYRVAILQRDLARKANPYYRLKVLRERPIWLKGIDPAAKALPDLTREHRVSIQKALNFAGYSVGKADGVFGPATLEAVARARRDAELTGAGDAVDADLVRFLPDPYQTEKYLLRKAQIFEPSALPDRVETRLASAVKELKKLWATPSYVFGYFEGHFYIVVAPSGAGALGSAKGLSKSLGGYLTTINSRAENDFLVSLFRHDKRFLFRDDWGNVHGPAIGLYQLEGSREPAGGWVWANGEQARYRNWSSGNPDNSTNNRRKSQNFAGFFGKRGALPRKWDDTSTWAWNGYIIEVPPQN